MDPISISGTLIALLQQISSIISTCYDYRRGIENPHTEAVTITNALNSLKTVSEALLHLVETSDTEGASQFPTIRLLAKKDGTLQHCLTNLEKLSVELKPDAGWAKSGRSLEWPLDEDELEEAVGELDGFIGTMRLALTADKATMTLAIQDDIQDLSRLFQRFSSDDTRHGLYRWIASCSPHSVHAANREKHIPNTGAWLLESEKYKTWLHSPQSFSWLFGIPGSGKTIMCSTIIEDLIRHTRPTPSTALAYFYFDFNDGGRLSFTALIQSLVTQLAIQRESMPASILEIYKQHQESTKLMDEGALIEILRELSFGFRKVYIVVDALNESRDVEEVLQFVQTVREWDHPELHLTVTSRQLPEIEATLTSLVTNKVCLHESGMKGDIELYIDGKFANDKRLSKWPSDIRSQIRAKLLDSECGVFQWVVCQFDMLQRCVSIAAVRKALDAGFPADLEITYDNIWLGIEEGHQQEVLKVMGALAATVEPLHLNEIVELLAINFNSKPPKLQIDSRFLDPQRIISRCSSFVTMSKAFHQGFYGHQEPKPVLRLAHVSVAEYLFHKPPVRHMQFHFSRLSARQFLAQACLAYLLSPEFAKGYEHASPKRRQSVLTREHKAHMESHIKHCLDLYPFLRHAVKFWPMYLRREPGDPVNYLENRTKEMMLAFFDTRKLPNGGNFTFWVGVLNSNHPLDYIQNTQPLYYASSFGLTEVVQILLEREKDIDVNALGGRSHSTALHVSTFRDHMDIVKMLLERGADPNVPNDDDESPLFWAVENKDEAMQKLLLENGAEPLN